MFKQDSFVKIVDTQGNYRFGYICQAKDRGSILTIDLTEEGLSKINWDTEYALAVGQSIMVKDFNVLLTETEKKIVPMLARCQTTKEIAFDMNICPVTVRAHIRDLKIKLQCDSREQLFIYCQGIMRKLANGNRED